MLLASLHRRSCGSFHGVAAAIRYISSASPPPPPPSAGLDISHPTYMVWGSNTGVGKTLVSAGLAFSVLSNPSSSSAPAPRFLFLKPVQTGFPADSDSRFVHRKVTDLFLHRSAVGLGLIASNHAFKGSASAATELLGADAVEEEEGMRAMGWGEETEVRGLGRSELVCRTLYSWKGAVSPHLAVEREKAAVADEEVLDSVRESLGFGCSDGGARQRGEVWRVVETAGGVASPGPSGTLQCDLYRPFRLPAILVGDGRLGGISGTISSYESLKLRGYDVVAVVLEDHGLSNELPLLSYLRNRVHVLVMPHVPRDPSNNLIKWFQDSREVFNSLRDSMLAAYSEKIRRLHEMPTRAGDILWWPFTQHNLVPKECITVIDSRCGEKFAVHKTCSNREYITPQFDACASWWTQGPDATLQIELAKDMGYAAGRFGHVMFPENVYEPALDCAELLIEGVGQGWASRVFFSDNGSTAIEIALKMAFRKFSYDHGLFPDCRSRTLANLDLKVLALNGSYHGDTLGAMEAQAPSSYTSFLQQPWYSGRGVFLDPPTISMYKGKLNMSIPKSLNTGKWRPEDTCFNSHDELFCGTRDSSDLAQNYSSYISKQLSQISGSSESACIGALIIEPVIQGAGGMLMIDPLFQRILVKECQGHKIPVIFDEVFTGFWRLGRESAAELLGCLPDIACYAKLMTGGIIPLAATLATEAVFEAFKGDSKIMALLHGHSYTAHSLGCTAAAKAIRWFKDPKTNLNISGERKLIQLWDMEILCQLSSHPAVERVVALGTLCAIELKADGSEAGYASLYASSLVQKLHENGIYTRPLGNVIYLMCGPCTSPGVCNEQLIKLYQGIDEFSEAKSAK